TSNDTDESPFDITLTGKGVAAKTSPMLAVGSRLPSWAELYSGADGSLSNNDVGSGRRETLTTVESAGGRKYLALAVIKRPGDFYQDRSIEVSPNLIDWYSGPRHTTVMEDSAAVFKARDNTPLTAEKKRFIRLEKTANKGPSPIQP
ncbi:MAG: hypothetical protein V4689_14835, partial [Verrucomicrobiota bacterium]